MKKVIGIVIVVIILLVIVFSVGDKKEVSGEPVKIGFIAALTGVGASVGEEELKGIELAVEAVNKDGGINGQPLEVVAGDVSLDKLKDATTVAKKLIDIDGVKAIVGPMWDEPMFPIAPIVEENKIPIIGHNTTKDVDPEGEFKYVFSTWYDNAVGVEEDLVFAQKKGWNNVVIIRQVAAGFWQFTRNIFLEKAPEYGINVVDDINIGDFLASDYRTVLTKANQLKPDAIFMVLGDYNVCVVNRQMNELGINIPILATESAGDPKSIVDCPEIMENMYYSTPKQSENYNRVVKDFENKYGREPLFPSVATAYDAVMVIAESLRETEGRGGEELRDVIAQTKDLRGVSVDSITFDEDGFVVSPSDTFEMMTVRNGEYVKAE